MDKSEVKVGMYAAVNDLPDGQVYEVHEVNGFRAELKYNNEHGTLLFAGWTDVSVLRKPTQAQMDHAGLSFKERRSH